MNYISHILNSKQPAREDTPSGNHRSLLESPVGNRISQFKDVEVKDTPQPPTPPTTAREAQN